jgi:hypothetical protein
MLANFFSKSKPVNFILVLGLFLVYYVLDSFIYRFEPFSLELLMILPLYLGVFFMFNFIVSKNKLTRDNSFAFLLFVVGLGCLPQLSVVYVILIEYLVLFLFLRRIYSLRTLKTLYQKLFDSGLWLGVLFLISPVYVVYLVLLFAALLLFAKITFRTVFIPILGFIVPVFLFFTYHFYLDSLDSFYKLFEIGFFLDFNLYSSNYYTGVFTVFGVFTFFAILLKTGSVFSVSNTFKRCWVLLLLHLLIALSSLFLIAHKDGTELIAILIPSTIIIANWMQSIERKLIVNFILILFLVMSFAVHFIV